MLGRYSSPASRRCADARRGCGTSMALSFTRLGGVVRWLQRRAGRPPHEPAWPADESGLTRRGLLAGAAAAGVAGALSTGTSAASAESSEAPNSTSTIKPRRFDVIVVGAGLAG